VRPSRETNARLPVEAKETMRAPGSDELESRGLVQRRPHPSDRRAHALHLTDAGRDILTSGRGVARAAQEELLSPLDADDRLQLHDLLLRIAEATHDTARRADGRTGGPPASSPDTPTD